MRGETDRFGPAAIAVTYVALGAVWILGSDRALLALVGGDAEQLAHLQTIKGWMYVAASGAVLYALMERRERALARQERRRRLLEAETQRLNVELEQRVRERTAELEVSTRELAAFSSSVSHDLRAPLRTISGFAGAILQDHGEALPPDARAHLARVVAAAARMADIIDSLLGLARVSQVELARRRVDVCALVEAVADDLRAHEPGRVVELACSGDPTVVADPGLLRIVVENLLSNAWKFTLGRDVAHVAVTCERREGETLVRVRDDGAGFEMDWSHRLFRPFERLHTVHEFPGSGIGLATVARIVARHGGRVGAEGRVGEGAAFWFTLPDVAEPPRAPPTGGPQPPS